MNEKKKATRVKKIPENLKFRVDKIKSIHEEIAESATEITSQMKFIDKAVESGNIRLIIAITRFVAQAIDSALDAVRGLDIESSKLLESRFSYTQKALIEDIVAEEEKLAVFLKSEEFYRPLDHLIKAIKSGNETLIVIHKMTILKQFTTLDRKVSNISALLSKLEVEGA